MKKLICTSYNQLADGSLQLRNNWIEDYSEEVLDKWNINVTDLEEPIKGISHILHGEMDLLNVVIHVRIVKY